VTPVESLAEALAVVAHVHDITLGGCFAAVHARNLNRVYT
jgi:hypothetical protein